MPVWHEGTYCTKECKARKARNLKSTQGEEAREPRNLANPIFGMARKGILSYFLTYDNETNIL